MFVSSEFCVLERLEISSDLNNLFKDHSFKFCLIGVALIMKLIKSYVNENVSRDIVMAPICRFPNFRVTKNHVISLWPDFGIF